MKIEIVPVSLRRLRQSNVRNYKEYLDGLIGMKLREWNRIDYTMTPRRTLRRAAI